MASTGKWFLLVDVFFCGHLRFHRECDGVTLVSPTFVSQSSSASRDRRGRSRTELTLDARPILAVACRTHACCSEAEPNSAIPSSCRHRVAGCRSNTCVVGQDGCLAVVCNRHDSAGRTLEVGHQHFSPCWSPAPCVQCLLALGLRHTDRRGVWSSQDSGLDSSLRGWLRRMGICSCQRWCRTLRCRIRPVRSPLDALPLRSAFQRCDGCADGTAIRWLVFLLYRCHPDQHHAGRQYCSSHGGSA